MINKIMINKMIKTLLMIFLVFAAPSLSLSSEKPKKISRAENYIAVLDLEIVGKVEKDIKRPLTDSIRLEIVRSGKWKVIERSNMDKILKEQKFQQACTSTECIVEIGQVLGVGKMIMGSVSMVGKTYYLSLQLVNVESGQIENVSEDECKCEIDDLIKSSKRLTKKLLGETVVETPQTTTSSDVPAGKEFKDPIKGMEMVFVKGGCFQMGDTFGDGGSNEKPVHEVCLDDFYIGKYEVTQGQWKAIMGNNPSYFKDCGDNCPVESVSWNDAQEFIRKLNQKTGKNYKLPTEAEWEYAAKSGGKNEKWAGGNDVDSVAWYDKNSGSKTHPVGQKKPNGLGLYDMSGNVWEWVNDWYDENYYKNSPKDNPKGANSTSDRVLRGGGWFNDTRNTRSAVRLRDYSDYGVYSSGFRLLLPVR